MPCLNKDRLQEPTTTTACPARRKRSTVQDEEDIYDQLEEVSRSIRQAADYEASISSSLSAPAAAAAAAAGTIHRHPRLFWPNVQTVVVTEEITKTSFVKGTKSEVMIGAKNVDNNGESLKLTCMPAGFTTCG